MTPSRAVSVPPVFDNSMSSSTEATLTGISKRCVWRARGRSRDNGTHAQNKQEVCHAAARDVAKCHVRMAVNGGNDRDHELGHGGSHGHDREADDAVGQANTRGYLA